MGIHIAIEHRTSYVFDRTTTIHPHIFNDAVTASPVNFDEGCCG